VADEIRMPITSDSDLIEARQKGRALAEQRGFASSELTLIATAISELARNIIRYAKCGEISIQVVDSNPKEGITIVARDAGPGIADVERALEAGYSTSGSLGLGLPGVRRIMDEFEIKSGIGQGTIVTVTKWKRR
jgi:serine/threonine-protein kinase RsbT